MTTMFKKLALTAIAVGGIAAATPSYAVVTTFANFSALAGTTSNIYWKNNGTNGSNGTGGSIYSIATNNATTAGSRLVNFSFLQMGIAPAVTNVKANFTLLASVSNTPAQLSNNFLIQPGIAGTFSFKSTTAITVNGMTYAAGSNLLTATFSQGAIFGQRAGSSGSFSASSTDPADTIVYSSDFLTFDPSSSLDFSFSLTAINSVLQAVPTNGTPTKALRNFRANATGSFSSDPAPTINAVPEPAIWGMMIAGFGVVGFQSRRRRSIKNVTA